MENIEMIQSQEKKSNIKPEGVGIDFEKLVYDLKLLDVKLLKLFYVPKATSWTLDNVVKKIKQRGTDVSKETVRRYILKLDGQGLLTAVKKSKPLAIQSKHKIEEDVNKLIILSGARLAPWRGEDLQTQKFLG